jgi:DNA-binding NarL/FixJ family response regulator
MIHVAIIEDDPSTLVGLRQIIEHAPDLILGTTAASVERFEQARARDINVVVLDLRLRGGGIEGEAAVRRLVEHGMKVLVVSISDEEVPVVTAIGAGAHGYLTKEAEPAEIVRAICAVASGRTYFSPTVAGFLLRKETQLTAREIEILRLVASGETTSGVARQLVISEKTVNSHLDKIRNKTGYRRRADLTRLAYKLGILSHFRKRGEGQ